MLMTMVGDHVFWKMALHKYAYIYACEKLFTKTQSLNLALALQAHFLEWGLTRFGKEIFICKLVDIYCDNLTNDSHLLFGSWCFIC